MRFLLVGIYFACISASVVSSHHHRHSTSDHDKAASTSTYSSAEPRITIPGCGISKHKFNGGPLMAGREALKGEFPWQVSLQRRNWFSSWAHACGGSILNEFWVVTAAHCVSGAPTRSIRVIVGAHSISSTATFQATHLVAKTIVHSGFNSNTIENDIALLRVITPINIAGSQGYVNGVCLPTQGQAFFGYGTVSGWGTSVEGGTLSNNLQAVDVPILTDAECRNYYKHDEIKDTMLCAGYPEGGKDSCQGDSGGPMVQKVRSRHVLIGLVSWGEGCARPGKPGVYTELARYIDWITRKIK